MKKYILAMIVVTIIFLPSLVIADGLDEIKCLTDERNQLIDEVKQMVAQISAPKEWKQKVWTKIERISKLDRQINRRFFLELSASEPQKVCLLPPAEKIPAKERFIVVSQDEIYDRLYYLIWQRCRRSIAMTYEEAVEYLKISGYRLPTLLELNSLVDRSEYNPTLPENHPFCPMGGEMLDYWTSNKWLSADSFRLTINFYTGQHGYRNINQNAMVWGVKNSP